MNSHFGLFTIWLLSQDLVAKMSARSQIAAVAVVGTLSG